MHVYWYWCEGHGCLEGRRVRGQTSVPCLLTAVSHYHLFHSGLFHLGKSQPASQSANQPASQPAAVWFFRFFQPPLLHSPLLLTLHSPISLYGALSKMAGFVKPLIECSASCGCLTISGNERLLHCRLIFSVTWTPNKSFA